MIEIDKPTIRLAAQKDEPAFKKVYDCYAPFVWRLVYKTVGGDRDAAVEIVQETFIRVYKSLSGFSFNAKLSTWIYRIALNAAKNYLFKKGKHSGLLEFDEKEHWDKAGDPAFETIELINSLLANLSPEDRFILTSREMDGVTFKELAEITGKSSESLRTRASRIKERFRVMAAAPERLSVCR
jgi:RNA polymerase sigma-70 factor (ECF subfamily)